ncbi:hypothetical protein Adt_34149 [Abeliophyllum distichum]|uniref:Uncharacterized protein n=1 Tax=Abeliophyllum distichum TaxID=126358 RepID=A0ABD1QYD8_9LAMI
MQRHKKLAADASKSEEAMEGLQVVVENMCMAYEQLHVDFKEFDTNVLHLTKKLDDANVAQKVTADALEAENEEKKRLLEELSLHRVEAEGLQESLEASEKGQKDA